ncbi:hypothetical protein T484DRAFT_3639963 [Baffinella frigidus]|nr:hypothetical protein T484DRAFT_3639963 [Cryptophyta sp. CCMP2293]
MPRYSQSLTLAWSLSLPRRRRDTSDRTQSSTPRYTPQLTLSRRRSRSFGAQGFLLQRGGGSVLAIKDRAGVDSGGKADSKLTLATPGSSWSWMTTLQTPPRCRKRGSVSLVLLTSPPPRRTLPRHRRSTVLIRTAPRSPPNLTPHPGVKCGDFHTKQTTSGFNMNSTSCKIPTQFREDGGVTPNDTAHHNTPSLDNSLPSQRRSPCTSADGGAAYGKGGKRESGKASCAASMADAMCHAAHTGVQQRA